MEVIHSADGDIIIHYGVKGMKWGQHIFGKKKHGSDRDSPYNAYSNWKKEYDKNDKKSMKIPFKYRRPELEYRANAIGNRWVRSVLEDPDVMAKRKEIDRMDDIINDFNFNEHLIRIYQDKTMDDFKLLNPKATKAEIKKYRQTITADSRTPAVPVAERYVRDNGFRSLHDFNEKYERAVTDYGYKVTSAILKQEDFKGDWHKRIGDKRLVDIVEEAVEMYDKDRDTLFPRTHHFITDA